MNSFKIFRIPTSILCFLIVFLTMGCAKATFRGKTQASLGEHYFSQNNFGKAVEYYEKAVTEDPDEKKYLPMLGWAYFKQGNYDAAILTFDKLAAVDVKALDAYTGQGWSHFKKGNYDQAIGYFEEAIKVDANSPDPYDGIGWASFNKGDLTKAEEYFNFALHKGLKFHPGLKTKTDPEAHRGLGYLYFSKGDFQTSLRHFKMASLLMPSWDDARAKWGDCLFSLKKYGDALGVYKHCLKAKRSVEVYDKMGWSYFNLAESTSFSALKNRRYKVASKMFNKALAIDPQYVSSLSGLNQVDQK